MQVFIRFRMASAAGDKLCDAPRLLFVPGAYHGALPGPSVVVGHSMGALPAALCATQRDVAGLVWPFGTRRHLPAIIEQVENALTTELNKPDVKNKFEGFGVTVNTMGNVQFTQFVKQDMQNWAEWVKIAKIQPQ
jgi:hypothetical protein